MAIFLIGFMGSGKSFTGKRLANLLDYSFEDLDTYLERKAGKTISELFATEGEAYFRKLERDCLHELGKIERLIVATGGGAPCFFDNMRYMKAAGTTIFLDTPVAVLLERLKPEMAHRPLLAGKTVEELTHFIEQKLDERLPYYQQANLIYKQEHLNEDVAAELQRILAHE